MAANMTVVTHLLNGRRVARFANRKTLSNDETVQEAIDGGYAVGKKEGIEQNAKGLLRSLIIGIQKDGNGRKINEYISLQPYLKGRLKDPTETVTKDNCSVRIAARVLKELQPDTSGWSFFVEKASSGTLNVTSVSTGEEVNVIWLGGAVEINGFGLAMGEGDAITWSILGEEKSGTVAASKITSEWTRITLDADVLDEIKSAEYNGKTIAFVIKIGGQTVSKTAALKFVA